MHIQRCTEDVHMFKCTDICMFRGLCVYFMFVGMWYYVCLCIDTGVLHIDVYVFVERSVYVCEMC